MVYAVHPGRPGAARRGAPALRAGFPSSKISLSLFLSRHPLFLVGTTATSALSFFGRFVVAPSFFGRHFSFFGRFVAALSFFGRPSYSTVQY